MRFLPLVCVPPPPPPERWNESRVPGVGARPRQKPSTRPFWACRRTPPRLPAIVHKSANPLTSPSALVFGHPQSPAGLPLLGAPLRFGAAAIPRSFRAPRPGATTACCAPGQRVPLLRPSSRCSGQEPLGTSSSPRSPVEPPGSACTLGPGGPDQDHPPGQFHCVPRQAEDGARQKEKTSTPGDHGRAPWSPDGGHFPWFIRDHCHHVTHHAAVCPHLLRMPARVTSGPCAPPVFKSGGPPGPGRERLPRLLAASAFEAPESGLPRGCANRAPGPRQNGAGPFRRAALLLAAHRPKPGGLPKPRASQGPSITKSSKNRLFYTASPRPFRMPRPQASRRRKRKKTKGVEKTPGRKLTGAS